MDDQTGRAALITGGSSGIGRAAALALADQGCSVAVMGLDPAETKEAADLVVDRGGQAVAIAGTIDSLEFMQAAVATTLEEFGRLDTLVTSAGVQRYGDAVDTSVETWDEVFDVNVKSVFLAAKAALPELRKSPAGSIIIVASVQATATQAQVVAYTASKGALLALGRAMAVDEAVHGVRVNTVSPGSVDTPMLRGAAALFTDGSEQAIESALATWGSAHALGRVAAASEIGDVIAYLASPQASFVTGADIRADGGLLARLAAPHPD